MRSFLAIVALVVLLAYAGACWFLHAKQREMVYYGWTTAADVASTDFELKRADATLRGWQGAPITRMTRQLASLVGHSYGV